jgi:hypothetical protein
MISYGQYFHQARLGLALGFLFHAALIAPVFAAEVKIGGRPLAFEPPSRYCLFDKDQSAEQKAIAFVRKFYAPSEIMVWMFGECARRTQWLSQSPTAAGRGGVVYVTKRQAVFRAAETMTRAAFLAEMTRTQPWRAIYKDLARRTAGAGVTFRLDTIKVLSSDDAAIYVGAVYSVPNGRGWISFAEVTALTVVHKLPVNVNVSAVGNEQSMAALLGDAKAQIRALIDRNEQDAISPSQANGHKQRVAAE